MSSAYTTLGRSGLRVSRLCLGTMTFGTEWGWGNPEDAAHAIFNGYLDAGGNFLDTADGYTGGTSERMIGKFLKQRGGRDRVVLATKFTFNGDPGNPNGGGNGRKNTYRALEGSLRRLDTDYVDLYWVHNWDTVTPVEEVVSTLTDLVREGKIRYYGFSNLPAWYVGRAQTLAELKSYERCIALQMEYSLLERSIEFEFVPAALELGMGITPWSPLASGMLSGKYKREQNSAYAVGDGRLEAVKTDTNPNFTKLFNERNWKIVDALLDVSKQLGKPPAQVALNWVTNRPAVDSTIIGATKLPQLRDNLAALDFTIPPEIGAQLDDASRPEPPYPYTFYGPVIQTMVNGGTELKRRSEAA